MRDCLEPSSSPPRTGTRDEQMRKRLFILWAFANGKDGKWKVYHDHVPFTSLTAARKAIPDFVHVVAEKGFKVVPEGIHVLALRLPDGCYMPFGM